MKKSIFSAVFIKEQMSAPNQITADMYNNFYQSQQIAPPVQQIQPPQTQFPQEQGPQAAVPPQLEVPDVIAKQPVVQSDFSVSSGMVGFDYSRIGVYSSISGVLGGLKEKIKQCKDIFTEEDELVQCKKNCYEEAIGYIKPLVNSVNDETLKYEVIKIISKLETKKNLL